MRHLAALAFIAGAGEMLAGPVSAQEPQRIQVEARVDAIASRRTGVEGALGVTVPVGVYVRSGLVVGAGGGEGGFESRADLISRFNLDPFRQSRWGLYGGGGLSGRYIEGDSPKGHAYILIFAGIEGPIRDGAPNGWVPAFEVGLGGGARVGLILRRAKFGRR